MLPLGRHLTVGREGAPVRGECALNPSRAHGDESILEWSQIDGLIEAAGVCGVQDILDAFWRSTDDLSANLKVQIAAGEFTEAARTAHAIKGSAANVGAQLLAEAARDIETYIKSDRKAGPEAALDRLARIYAETRAALEAHLAAQK
jgi:HPt (histidine-containing phosphotransfer) domain-containing protein